MEIRVLRYFLAVAREQSVTKAAARLHISQPTLSKQIKDLERELGKRLFVRGNYDMRLTDEGALLRKRAEDILAMVDRTAAEFASLDDFVGGDISIGCAETDGIKYLAQCVGKLQRERPGVRLHLYSGDTEDVTLRLDQGLLDFGVLVESADLGRYNGLVLPFTDILGVSMREDSPLAQKEVIQKEDLLDLPLICTRQSLRTSLLSWFGEEVDSLNIAATFNLSYNSKILVQEGLGYAISLNKDLFDTNPNTGLCFRPLYPRLESKMYLVWRKFQAFTPAAKALFEEIQKAYGEGKETGP